MYSRAEGIGDHHWPWAVFSMVFTDNPKSPQIGMDGASKPNFENCLDAPEATLHQVGPWVGAVEGEGVVAIDFSAPHLVIRARL